MYKPVYHFFPGKNWMNDPNGVCWYKGKYHLFYQYNPTGDQWGNLHWGHAVSEDCVRWKILPEALSPSTEKGEIHCFSGCASVDGEKPILYYTSVGEEKDGRDSRNGAQQWCAVGDDTMTVWEKYSGNPLMTKEMHGDLDVLEWRDPFVWKEDDGWYMVLGAEIDGKGAVLLYHSEDQIHWKYLHILLHSEDSGKRIFECPNYFFLQDKAVLVVSPNDKPCYWIGHQTADHKFVPETAGIIDHSGWAGFYAPNSFADNRGRRIMIGWLTENGRGDLKVPGWQGVQSIPRELMMENGILHMRPIEELEQLRCNGLEYKGLQIDGTWECPLKTKAAEIILETETESINANMELHIFADKAGEEKTVIRYEKEKDTVVIDRTYSNLSGLTDKTPLSCTGTHSCGGKLKLQVFIDHSVVEVFINEREVISTRVYPGSGQSEYIRIQGDRLSLNGLQVYEMKSHPSGT